MKKFIILIIILISILAIISYIYVDYKITYNQAMEVNRKFERYENKEIEGTELATILNFAVDTNSKNNIQKDNDGKYIDDGKNSIEIEINITDNNTIYDMETIYDGQIERFVQNYGKIKFICRDVQYHKSTNKIKYMLFEQMTN